MIDYQLIFSDKQTLAAGDSTNTLDQKYKWNQACGFLQVIGHGVTGATSVTVTLKESDDNSTWESRETQTFSDIAALNKGLTAMALLRPLKRYVKLTYAIGGTVSAGTITAYLTNKVTSPSVYPTNRV